MRSGWEKRTFPPSSEFKKDALVTGSFMYDDADEDYQGFWANQAADLLDWTQDWHTICEWELPFAKWFVGGTLNVSYNCLDRHVLAGKGDKVAFYFEGEPGDTRTVTYAELLDETQRFANVLKGLGVGKGDRVNIYLPMIPEAAVAMLACARIGAAHSVVFGGLQLAVAQRPDQRRRGQGAHHRRRRVAPRRGVPAQARTPTRRCRSTPTHHRCRRRAPRRQRRRRCRTGRDHWYHELMAAADPVCPAEPMDTRAAAVPALHLAAPPASRRASCTRAAAT